MADIAIDYIRGQRASLCHAPVGERVPTGAALGLRPIYTRPNELFIFIRLLTESAYWTHVSVATGVAVFRLRRIIVSVDAAREILAVAILDWIH